ncbi:reverse transcriptase domain-containing protein [Tanacetum coccineum]
MKVNVNIRRWRLFIKEFRTTNELLLKERSNLLSELEIKVNELSKVMGNVLVPKKEVTRVITRGGKMTSSKEINETGINKNEPPRFEQDVQEKPHDDGVENKSLMLEKHKEAEDLVAYHLSRFENMHMEVLNEREIVDKLSDEHLMVLKSKFNNDEPWYADFVDYIVGKVVPLNWTFEKRKRRCVAGSETLEILAHYYSGPTGGHHSALVTAKKVYESGFYWPKDANEYVRQCDACQRSRNMSSRNEMPQNNIHVYEVFDVWGLDFMGPFPQSRGNKYILVVVDYVSKWVEAQAFPTNDAHVVVKFLRSLFARFGVPKALISDTRTHFCNSQLEKALQRYGVTYKLSMAYHPQSNGQTKVTNKAIKHILERSVGYNPKDWSENLNDALLAFKTAYKTPTWCTHFRLVYVKACHLLVKIKHKAHWALKQYNMDLTLASESRLMQLNELAELRDGAYENTRIYKERTKKWHDSSLHGDKDFKIGGKVLLYNSRLKMFPGKLKSK